MASVNQLKYLDEFQACLKNYQVSDAAAQRIADLHLVLLVAPSSSGRNTIIQELMKTGEFYFIVSDTTRSPRVNDGVMEQSGREYWFRDEEQVLQEIKNGDFLEAAILHQQQVSGISIRELEKAERDNKIAITDIDIVGARNIHAVKPNAYVVFIVPPDFETWTHRLRHRGELPEDEVRRRLESALEEFRSAVQEDYYIFAVNDQLEEAVAAVYEIAKSGHINQHMQQRGRDLVETLLRDTENHLARNV